MLGGGDVLRNVDHRGVAAGQPRRRLYAPADPGADDDAFVAGGVARPHARIVDLTDLDDLTVVAWDLRPPRRVGAMPTIEPADLVTCGQRHPAGRAAAAATKRCIAVDIRNARNLSQLGPPRYGHA